jgi:hypothetical protein
VIDFSSLERSESQYVVHINKYHQSAFLLGVKGGSGQAKILVTTPENQRPVGRSNDLRAEQQGGAP